MPARRITQLFRSIVATSLSSAAALFFLASNLNASAQTAIVLHWINDSNQNAVVLLNSTSNFITSFKGTNDVHITLLAGSVNSVFAEGFGGLANNNNPGYLTNFVGLSANGTGDGARGHIDFLESSLGAAMTLQFDFAVPLTPADRLLFTDVDTNEKYGIQAFSAGQVLNLTGWTYTPYSGEEPQLPDTTWPTWAIDNNTNGTLTANTSSGLMEPLSSFTPDHTVDRIIITRFLQGGGSSALQFLNQPTSTGQPVLTIHPAGTNVLITWPTLFPNYALYTTTNLTPSATWTAIGGSPAVNFNQLVVTNNPSVRARFYRLQIQ